LEPTPGTTNHKENEMGALYNKMARDLALKNLAVTTQKEYLRCCCHFVRYHMTSTDSAFNLVRRSALAKTKGLEWLKLETGDDVALGAMMKKAGARCDMLLGGEDVHLEFYPSFTSMMRAVEKNGASAPAPMLLLGGAMLVALEAGFLAGFAVGGAWAWASAAMLVVSALLAWRVAVWVRAPIATSPITWLGSIPFSFVLVRSVLLAVARGGIVWRGTFYPTKVIAKGRRYFSGNL
jgi:hypothetical protein